ncbi:Endoglucanase B [Coccomyxa sp. Obi]|nr:Endoglucanase B [Coccomyxa sp. Obi]
MVSHRLVALTVGCCLLFCIEHAAAVNKKVPSGTAVTAKQARLKKESAEKCDDSNAAHCYDHTTNAGIGAVKVSDKFPATDKSAYDYSEVLHKSFLFYFQQRSGKLPHQRLAWRTDSCAECHGPSGEDLSGGYYEAGGSYLKFSFPTAFTITQLAWGVVEHRSGYEKVGELEEALDAIKWGTDYLLNCHVEPMKFVAMYGSSEVDFGYFGPPEEHLQWTQEEREVTYITPEDPSSEICGEVAAAFAASSLALRDTHPEYADKLVEHAKQMLEFGMEHPGSYMKSKLEGLKDHGKHYPSTNYNDEMALGAVWLYFATGEDDYLQTATMYYDKLNSWKADNYAYDWDNKSPALHVLLTQIYPSEMMKYGVNAKQYFEEYLPGPKRTVFHTKKGLSWRNAWGVLRYSANNAFLALVHSAQMKEQGDETYAATLFTYATQQINYMLGDAGRSFVVGFGKNPPSTPFHKWSFNAYIDYPTRGQSYEIQHDDFHNTDRPNQFLAYGALVGGPNADDTFEDSRGWCCAAYNEVAIDYNAAFTGAIARLVDFYSDMQPFSDCTLDLGWSHKNATLANKPNWPANDCYHGCCEGAAKAPARKEAAAAAPAKAEKEAIKKEIAKVVEAAAEAQEAKAEDQAHAGDSKPHASGRGAERKHRRNKDNKGGQRDRRQARIGL